MLPRAIFYIFHCCPEKFYWLSGQYFVYFIAAQEDISLVAWGNILFILLLPRMIFHWLHGATFYLFYCCLGQYFIIIGPFSWMHLALDFGRKNICLKSRINFPAISAAIGGAQLDGWQHYKLDDIAFLEALQIHHILMDLVDC